MSLLSGLEFGKHAPDKVKKILALAGLAFGTKWSRIWSGFVLPLLCENSFQKAKKGEHTSLDLKIDHTYLVSQLL